MDMSCLPERAAVALVVLISAAACAPTAPVLKRSSEFHRGIALGLFGDDAGLQEDLDRLEEIRDVGATDVSLVLTWTQQDVRASTVAAHPAYTASKARLIPLIRRARALGLRVMLFPIVRLIHRTPAEWRGLIAPGDRAAWFASYGALVGELATVAADEGVAALSIGSELVSLEPEVERWRALIAEVRRRFHGVVLYSANWDRYAGVPLWNDVDLIGISAYWDLTPHGRRPSEEEVRQAWQPIRRALTGFSRSVGRPILFTEFGYPSVVGGGASPWNDFATGVDGVEDGETQRRLYEAFAREWGSEPALAGAYAWLWFGNGGLGDRSYTPRHKPAEQVLRVWHRDPRVVPPPR